MSGAEDNYDSSIFFFRGINETYDGKKTRKILELIEELKELMHEFGTKKYFVEFIGEIHDNESLDKFRDARDLRSKFFKKVHEFRAARAAAAAAAPAEEEDAAAPASHYHSRPRSRGGKKKSHKKSHKKGGKKSHKKSAKKSHKKSHRRRH